MRDRIHIACQRGFSLIEMVQVLVIFGIVMSIVFGLFLQVGKLIERRENYQQALDNTERSASRIARSISSATGWINGDSLGITLVDAAENRVRIQWSARDRQVCLNGANLLPGRVEARQCLFSYLPQGGAGVPEDGSLFDAADRDRNGILEGAELKSIQFVEIKLQSLCRGQTIELRKLAQLPPPIIDIVRSGER